jgi:hypothetical protein
MWVEDPSADLEIEQYPVGLYGAIALAMLMTILLLPGFGVVVDVASSAAEAIVL